MPEFWDFWDEHFDKFYHADIEKIVFPSEEERRMYDGDARAYEEEITILLDAHLNGMNPVEEQEFYGKKLSQQELIKLLKSAANKRARRIAKLPISKSKLKNAEQACAQKCAELKQMKAKIKADEKAAAQAKKEANKAAKKAAAQANKAAKKAAAQANKAAKKAAALAKREANKAAKKAAALAKREANKAAKKAAALEARRRKKIEKATRMVVKAYDRGD